VDGVDGLGLSEERDTSGATLVEPDCETRAPPTASVRGAAAGCMCQPKRVGGESSEHRLPAGNVRMLCCSLMVRAERELR
jgi:hypothetical protein